MGLGRKQFTIVLTSVVLLCAAALAVSVRLDSSEPANPSQPTAVVPHLVPDVGTPTPGSPGSQSRPTMNDGSGAEVIPPAGGAVTAHGGTASQPTVVPALRQ